MKKISTGIEPLKKSIRIWWRVSGVRERETLEITPTADNIAYARGLANTIKKELSLGVFNPAKHFPKSHKNPEQFFGFYIEQWRLVQQKTLAPSSWRAYDNKVARHIAPKWAMVRMANIDINSFEGWVYDDLHPVLSTKTIKDIVMLWRSIWQYWARNQAQAIDPTKFIKLHSKDSEDIDPYTSDEIHKILKADDQNRNLWTVMLWSGLSTHELLALAAEDLKDDKLFIKRGFVDGKHRVTKNRRRKRQVDLLPSVLDALKSQISIVKDNKPQPIKTLERDHNSYKTEYLTFLWYNEDTGTHYTYKRLETLWRQHLKRVGVRYRALNNARHTYASQVLSTGAVSAEWLANQLGHTSTAMIHKHYGKFIPKDAGHIVARLAKALEK